MQIIPMNNMYWVQIFPPKGAFMQMIEMDDDGYPTDESLDELLEVLNGKDIDLAHEAFFDAITGKYPYAITGPTIVDVRGNPTEVLQFHTQGWSGNETIIRTLKESRPWSYLREREDRGGHYYFAPRRRSCETEIIVAKCNAKSNERRIVADNLQSNHYNH